MNPSVKTIRKRRRPAHSCLECRRRKVRCDRNKPCAQCSAHQVASCVYTQGNNVSPILGHSSTMQRGQSQIDGQRTADTPNSGDSVPHDSTPAPASLIRGTLSKTRIYGHGHWMNTVATVSSSCSLARDLKLIRNVTRRRSCRFWAQWPSTRMAFSSKQITNHPTHSPD